MFFNTPRVLIIDDDASLRRQIKFRLEKHEGLTVVEAKNGESGLVSADVENPDLIILDWVMPDIQGPEVLDQLKLKSNTQNIPIIMLTGKNKIGNIEDAFNLGADAYLTKPFSLQKLGEKVHQLLTSKN